MRSLPTNDLIVMIIGLIKESISLPFMEFITTNEVNDMSILVAPEQKDKIILVNVIGNYLLQYTNLPKERIDKIIAKLIAVYNENNFVCLYNSHLYSIGILFKKIQLKYIDDINFISEDEKLLNRIKYALTNKKQLSEEDFDLLRIQIFMLASVWLNMDEFLKYIYYYYTT